VLEVVGDMSPHSLDDQCILEAARTSTRLRILTVPATFLERQTQFKEAKGYFGPGKAFHMLARWSTQGSGPRTLVIISSRQVDRFITYAFGWLAERGVSFVLLNRIQERATQLTLLPAYYCPSPASCASNAMGPVLRRYIADVRAYCTDNSPGQPLAWRPTTLCIRIRPDQLVHLRSIVSAAAPLCSRVDTVELPIIPTEGVPDEDIPPSMVVQGLVSLQTTLKKVIIRQGERPRLDPIAARMTEEFLLAAKHVGLDMVDEVRFWNRVW